MEVTPCPSCERGFLEDRGGSGRFFPLRGFGELELPADVLLPTCNFCHQFIPGPSDAQRFDEGMQRAYQARLAEMIGQAVSTLTDQAITQQDLELRLGLSRGYISKLKGGKDSSRVMAALLGLLAADPVGRLKELTSLFEGKASATNGRSTISFETSESAAIAATPLTFRKVPAGRNAVLALVRE